MRNGILLNVFFVVFLGILFPLKGFSDVTARFTMTYQSGDLKGTTVYGKFSSRQGKVRLDIDKQKSWPDPKVFIYDSVGGKVIEISPVRKTYAEMGFDSPLFADRLKTILYLGAFADIKKLNPKDFDSKKVGLEEVAGHLAELHTFRYRWRNDFPGKIWIAEDLGSVPLKIETVDPKMRSTSMVLSEIQMVEHPEGNFSAPESYAKVLDEVEKKREEDKKRMAIAIEKQKAELRKNEAFKKMTPEQRKQLENFLLGGQQQNPIRR